MFSHPDLILLWLDWARLQCGALRMNGSNVWSHTKAIKQYHTNKIEYTYKTRSGNTHSFYLSPAALAYFFPACVQSYTRNALSDFSSSSQYPNTPTHILNTPSKKQKHCRKLTRLFLCKISRPLLALAYKKETKCGNTLKRGKSKATKKIYKSSANVDQFLCKYQIQVHIHKRPKRIN